MKKHPKSETAKVLKKYLKILKENNNHNSQALDEFIAKLFK